MRVKYKLSLKPSCSSFKLDYAVQKVCQKELLSLLQNRLMGGASSVAAFLKPEVLFLSMLYSANLHSLHSWSRASISRIIRPSRPSSLYQMYSTLSYSMTVTCLAYQVQPSTCHYLDTHGTGECAGNANGVPFKLQFAWLSRPGKKAPTPDGKFWENQDSVLVSTFLEGNLNT